MAKKRKLSSRELSEIKHFDEMATIYDTNYTYDVPFTRYKIEKKIDLLFGNYRTKKKIRILEIGAGTGEYTQYIAQLFPQAQIHVTDISPNILEVAKKKCKKYPQLKFEVASAYDLPYEDNYFDIVCGFYILHHLDLQPTWNEIYRVLKKGGNALFYEPNILNPVVFAIKRIPALKKMAGDSPHEWALNPLKLNGQLSSFSKTDWQTTEFIAVPAALPFSLAVTLDKVASIVGSVPGLNLLGGSVAIDASK